MIGQQKRKSRDGSPGKTLLRPLNPIRRRTEEVVERIAAQIADGDLRAGARLPTEQAMMTAMGVSRTVVREAISALRAQGLVTTRQGAGAFVNNEPGQQPYAIDPEGLGSLGSVIEILELRTAVEIEAAAIASERATAAQIKAIAKAAHIFRRAIASGDRAIKEDFDFHFAIAVGTRNSRFVGFLEFLGGVIIPRQTIRTFDGKEDLQTRYLQSIEREHQMIVDAISERSPRKAREAMRRHLVNGKARYKQLATEAAR
ncbi:FadR family transcriptional regulator [Tardiphaga alba]|uniref:FadR family transcriptional regulator n=1 Tax=Tardiphaga alba TaxID=340268 RepID=A0ABX8AFD3_9BRAD|nr:FadR/GntR family transcriptional regulator [Tardiphaga alba]QUS41636.1 FadR family transcriptional regulator [Tardiphaga alba]